MELPDSTTGLPLSRWKLLAGDVTTIDHSPATVWSPVGHLSALRRRSNNVTQAERIQQSLATLDQVVEPHSLTTPDRHSRSFLRSRHTGLHDVFSTQHTPLSTSHYAQETQNRSVSFLDESGMLKDLMLEHTLPSYDATMMSPSTNWQLKHNLTFQETSHVVSDVTLMDDPLLQAGNEFMELFHSCLSDYPNPGQIIDLLFALDEVCNNQIDNLRVVAQHSGLADTLVQLNLEQNTWQLAAVLYTDRLTMDQNNVEDMTVDRMKPQTDKTITEKYYSTNAEVRQAQLVVDWLEKISRNSLNQFPDKIKYFADSVSWENTVHDIQQGLNKGMIVSEVDPDAPTRQNKRLSELDESDELSLSKHLFKCIRAGQLERAQELCVKCGQAWKAVTLNGWKLYHDPNLGKGVGEEVDPVEGNIGRDLWKFSCWEISKCPYYSSYEKAIYAALSGNINQLLPACVSWYDYVWAYYKVMVDVLVEQKLHSSIRYPPGRETEELPKEYWNAILVPDLIFQEIEASPSQMIRKQYIDPYHMTQKHLILGNLDFLVNDMYIWLVHSNPNTQQLRFMAHMVLFVRAVGVNYDESKCNIILETFIQALIKHEFDGFVALYTSFLPLDMQISCYSNLLEGTTDTKEQKKCLQLAQEHGLNVAAITKRVVENIRMKGMDDVPEYTSAIEMGHEIEITESDRQKIHVINWLLYEDSHREEAVHQANALIRGFLAVRKHSAAQEVFMKIPPDSINILQRNWKSKAGNSPYPLKLTNDIREYLSIKAYLEALESFNEWFQYYHHSKPAPPPEKPKSDDFTEHVAFEKKFERYEDEHKKWKTQLEIATKEVEGKIYNVLLFVKGGWMVDEPGDEIDETRLKQLSLLRQLCLPKLCFLLHTVFYSTGNYKKSLQLADVVAAERSKLYQEFRQDELKHFLHLLYSSALALVDSHDLDPLGYEVA